MIEVELNNGKIIQMERIRTIEGPGRKETHEEMLLRIMDKATDKLGHVPTFEEAKKCPWMPKRPDLYDKYCNFYDTAVRKVKKLRSNRKAWRKMTPEEKAEVERLEEIGSRRNEVSDVFTRPPNWLAQETKRKGEKRMEEKNTKKKKTRTTKESAEHIAKRQKAKEECIRVVREFARENLRWPTESEIRGFRAEKTPGWMCAQSFNNYFGTRDQWSEAFFPEGLPEGFVEKPAKKSKKKTQVAEPKTQKKKAARTTIEETDEEELLAIVREVKSKDWTEPSMKKRASKHNTPTSSETSKTPREIFLNAVGELLAVVNGAGTGRVDLLMAIQLGDDEPIDFDFSINTLK